MINNYLINKKRKLDDKETNINNNAIVFSREAQIISTSYFNFKTIVDEKLISDEAFYSANEHTSNSPRTLLNECEKKVFKIVLLNFTC